MNRLSPTLIESLLNATRDGGVLQFDRDNTSNALRATLDRGRFRKRVNLSLAELDCARFPDDMLAIELDHLNTTVKSAASRGDSE